MIKDAYVYCLHCCKKLPVTQEEKDLNKHKAAFCELICFENFKALQEQSCIH